MTFEKSVSFENTAIYYNSSNDFFDNNGIMTFKGNVDVRFENFINKNTGILNFNGNNANVKGNIINEGEININGKTKFIGALHNEGNGILTINAQTIVNSNNENYRHIYNKNGATLHIQGSTISVNAFWNENATLILSAVKGTLGQGTFWNFKDAILVFSAVNGTLGQLIGNFINYADKNDTSKNEGKVIVNVRGLSAGTKYQIINGTQIQLEEKDVSFLYGTGQYLDNGWMWIDEFFALKTPIIATHRANVATMNNMFLASNAVMSAHHKNTKFRKMANRNNKVNLLSLQESEANKTIYFEKCLDCHELQSNSRNDGNLALDSLKSNKSFFYNSQDLAKNSVNLTKNHSNLTTNLNAKSTDLANPNDNFFFLLTPFVNHTSFKAMGDYQISGLDYGFISAFGGKVSKNHTLGTHFALDYANLGDKNDKSVKITNLNLMAGLNYRADLIYAMYLKARGDFYYFLNSADSSEMTTAKPNNLGFGLSVAFGKDFDFKQGGILGIELGLDYKAFHTSKVSANDIWGNASDEYKSVFYHLLYLDLGLNYYKYFSIDSGLWGIDAGFGIRGNLTPKVSNGTLMVANRAVDITLDNDNMLDYVSVGGSYVLEAQRFDMEFTLRYNGSFGDKSISNGGSFEWRVRF